MQILFQFPHRIPSLLTKAILPCLVAGLLIAGCSHGPGTPFVGKATSTVETAVALTAPASTTVPSLAPTLTPKPTPPTAILVAPAGSDQALVDSLKAALEQQASASALAVIVKDRLAAGDLSPAVRIVVAVSPDPGLAALAAAAPSTQFVGVEINGLKPAANLSLIGDQGSLDDAQAFLAGYLAALVTPDWRVGVINPADNTVGAAVGDAFKNGARYFCGLCRPAYPPFVVYPQSSTLANPSDQASWQASADALLGNGVQTVYVPPQVSTPDLLDYLDKAKAAIISGQMPSGQKYGHWLASIHPDPGAALTKMWPDLLAGKGGATAALPLVVDNVDSNLLSSGKMRLVQQTIDDLSQGAINPDTVAGP